MLSIPGGKRIVALILVAALFGSQQATASGWSGYVAGEYTYFPIEPRFDEQHQSYLSLSFQPEYYHEWKGGDIAFTFEPFARIDQHDEQRTHADIRELSGLFIQGDWEWRVGVSKVFWGVTESQHLVDVINQTDLVESIDQEEKLGQPMVHVSWIKEWGVSEFFVLPGFRERTYAGSEGRLRADLIVDTDNPVYESEREYRHVDYALRWSHTLGDWDIGLAYFNGTSRDPVLTPALDSNGVPVLIPVYNLMQQYSIDVQAILGDWVWKLEAINRDSKDQDHSAAVGGFEYTLVGIFGSNLDLGLLAEYNYDDRGAKAPTPFQNDVFAGARLTFNDAQSTDMLIGVFFDLDYDTGSMRVEASRRLGESWKLEGELQIFDAKNPENPTYFFRDDDYVRADLAWFF